MKTFKLDETGTKSGAMGKNFKWVVWPGTGANRVTLHHGRIKPGESYRSHHHAYSEDVVTILQGTCKVVGGNEEAILKAGETVWWPVGEEHTMINVGSEDVITLGSQGPPDLNLYGLEGFSFDPAKRGLVEVLEQTDMTRQMKERLAIAPAKTAILSIDEHRGHLDPAVATMPVDPADARVVVANSQKLFNIARAKGIKVIHVVMTLRNKPTPSAELLRNPFWAAVEEVKQTLTPGRDTVLKKHNIENSVQCEIPPGLYDPADIVVNSKKRLSAFYCTDLEVVLRTLEVDTLVLVGINTNTCVTCSAFEAFNRDYKVVVISDCVASMYGQDLHVLGLQNIQRCLGWVLSLDEFAEKLK
ncbi:MAG: isochorismatase family protein [Eubacteriales bacterium]